jgi:hypothetical protein
MIVFLESWVDLVVISGLSFSYFFLGVILMFTDSLLISRGGFTVSSFLTEAGFLIFLILTFGLVGFLRLRRLSNDVIDWLKFFIETECFIPFDLLRLR